MKIITASWDDGLKESIEIADILKKHRLKGTFYVPLNAVRKEPVHDLNVQGPFLNEEELKSLSEDFEIGAHGITHRYFTEISTKEVEKEIKAPKQVFKDILGEEILGVAYPRGKFNPQIVEFAKKSGYTYARTVKDGKLEVSNRFEVPISVFCHNTLISRGKFSLLAPFSKVRAFGGDWEKCVLKGYENVRKDGGVLHIAGHPQDLSDPRFGRKLRRVLSKISGDPGVEYLTNAETVEKLQEEGYLE